VSVTSTPGRRRAARRRRRGPRRPRRRPKLRLTGPLKRSRRRRTPQLVLLAAWVDLHPRPARRRPATGGTARTRHRRTSPTPSRRRRTGWRVLSALARRLGEETRRWAGDYVVRRRRSVRPRPPPAPSGKLHFGDRHPRSGALEADAYGARGTLSRVILTPSRFFAALVDRHVRPAPARRRSGGGQRKRVDGRGRGWGRDFLISPLVQLDAVADLDAHLILGRLRRQQMLLESGRTRHLVFGHRPAFFFPEETFSLPGS